MLRKIKTRKLFRIKKNKSRKKQFRKKTGGAKYTSGADTCVFIPQVGCQDNSTPTIYKTSDYISRIVLRSSPDVDTETFIRNNFGEYVDKGWISVMVHSCTPTFTETNLMINTTSNANAVRIQRIQKRPCLKITNEDASSYTNLITKLYNKGSYYKYCQTKSFTVENHLDNLRTALNAAVALVPDKGPWVIHTDCHHGNIFVDIQNDDITTGIGDWGRSILISDIKDKDATIRGINNNMITVGGQHWLLNRYIDWVYNNFGRLYQHSNNILLRAQQDQDYLLSSRYDKETAYQHLKALRGWTAYAILNGLRKAKQNPLKVDITPILLTSSQKELQDKINELLGKEGYIHVVRDTPEIILPARTKSDIELSEKSNAATALPRPISHTFVKAELEGPAAAGAGPKTTQPVIAEGKKEFTSEVNFEKLKGPLFNPREMNNFFRRVAIGDVWK